MAMLNNQRVYIYILWKICWRPGSWKSTSRLVFSTQTLNQHELKLIVTPTSHQGLMLQMKLAGSTIPRVDTEKHYGGSKPRFWNVFDIYLGGLKVHLPATLWLSPDKICWFPNGWTCWILRLQNDKRVPSGYLTYGKWWKMMKNDGKWWKMMENDGKWWKMMENDGKWWKIMENDGKWWKMTHW